MSEFEQNKAIPSGQEHPSKTSLHSGSSLLFSPWHICADLSLYLNEETIYSHKHIVISEIKYHRL